MPIVVQNILNQIRAMAASGDDRTEKARRLAERIQKLGDYRWVGVYDVGSEVVSIIAWSGLRAPEFPTFPISKGLTSAAIERRETVIAGDVRNNPRYLTTFGNTLSEIIVPVLDPSGERVIGTVDVESERANAFSASDQQTIEQCAKAALPLWLLR
jgi:putative methionine-R-sulfoxide reductase with GAF domain